MNIAQADMNKVRRFARQSMRIADALGSGFLIAVLGGPLSSPALVHDASWLRYGSDRERSGGHRRIPLSTDRERPTGESRSEGEVTLAGTLIVEGSGITVPVTLDAALLREAVLQSHPAPAQAA